MRNSGEIALARVSTPARRVSYAGPARIDGVPGHHAAVPLMFTAIAGAMCGALLPTGRPVDMIDAIPCTLIDNGMPVVVMPAAAFGLTGHESPRTIESDAPLRARIEAIRLQAGPLMNLGNVAAASVPKMTLVSPPARGGAIMTRSLIPHHVHAGIGVLAAVSVATACLLPGGPAAAVARLPADGRFLIEHPGGAAEVLLDITAGEVTGAGTLRTARKLFDGRVFPAPA
jgi:4-oxalomesaconate tautomerase